MNLNPDRLYQLPDEEAFPYYQALWYAGLADAAIHLQGSLVAHRLGRLHSAHSAILQAKACNPEGDLKGKIDFEFADTLRGMGKLEEAVEQFTEWLNNVDGKFPVLRDQYMGVVHNNRGLALRQLGRYSESLEDYRRASDEFRRLGQSKWLCIALQNLAWVGCLTGQDQIAGEALTEAEPLCTTAEAAWKQKIGQALYMTIAAEADLQRAMSLCQEIVDCSDPEIPAAVRAQAYWIAGRVALALGHLPDAEKMAERALLWGAAAGPEVRCLIDASALWKEIREQTSNSNT